MITPHNGRKFNFHIRKWICLWKLRRTVGSIVWSEIFLPVGLCYLLFCLWSERQALLRGILKDMEQRTRETCKITDMAAGVTWEVLNWELKKVHNSIKGVALNFRGGKHSFSALEGHISTIKSMQIWLVAPFLLFFF